MEFPEELKYSKEHIWMRIDGNRAVVGITDYAQQELGDIAAVELPEEGDQVEQEDSMGSVEARKTVAELYAPVSGTVISVNEDIVDNSSLINDDPYDSGWLLELELDDCDELKSLMSSDDYAEYVEDNEE